MPGSFTVTTTSLQSATLLLDSGTKPATTDHYLIKRKPSGTAFAVYLVIYKTTEATIYDHPRPRSPDGTQLNWDYIAYSYITATSSYDSGISVTNKRIAVVTDAQIQGSSVAEPTTSGGTISNTYLAQTETKPTDKPDEDSWTVTRVIPLAASSQ